MSRDPTSHPSLRHSPSNLIGGVWAPIPGDAVRSINPAHPGRTIHTCGAPASAVDQAVHAARKAFPAWSRAPREKRFAVLRRVQQLANERVEALTALLRDEVGKPTWDAKAEAQLIASKIDITLDPSPQGGLARVAGYELPITDSRRGVCSFRPHGVMAVVGPFNFPAHLPNGHIAPALAMGNTVVFKPSDKTPAVGQFLAELYDDALRAEGAPQGVVNMVQGAAGVAAGLVGHADIDGVLFTGSWPVGRRILEANLEHPGRIIALEMGGNSAAIIMDDADLKQAVIECVRSAFITSGQRCTCTRRVIVHRAVAAKVIPALCKAASALIIGDPASTHPVFMGPVISEPARRGILEAQHALHERATGLVTATAIDGGTGGFYVTPGITRVDRFTIQGDGEIFGPVLQVSECESFDDAMDQANATRFGLVASLFTKDRPLIDRFMLEARAGCLNINAGTAGASSKLPFGGLGHSGNHRPAGSFSTDYCAYPVASMIETGAAATIATGMRFDDAWL